MFKDEHLWTDRDVGGEAGDQRGSDGVRDGCVGIFRLLSSCCDDVKPNEGVETRSCTFHDLDTEKLQKLLKTLTICSSNAKVATNLLK